MIVVLKTYMIKGMVCDRCIIMLSNQLGKYDVTVNEISLGKVSITFDPEKFNEVILTEIVNSLGFTLGSDKQTRLVDQVLEIIDHYFYHFDPVQPKRKISELLSERLHMSYDNISSIFSSARNITIENYVIQYRINLVKKLLASEELTLTEIAFRTGFSSVHHLSKQFKQTTGQAPSNFRMAVSIEQTGV